MDKRQILRIAGGGFIAAAMISSVSGCSSALPSKALQAWKPPADDLEIRRWMISHALLAPNAHNLQSWLVDLDQADTIVLRMDMTRLLPETDPWSRQLVISQGTFIELLDLAAKERGYRADIEIFPEGAFNHQAPDSRPTAKIHLTKDDRVKPDPLFAYIFNRHTHRGIYDNVEPSNVALETLSQSVNDLPVKFGVITSADPAMHKHQQIAMDAWRIEMTTGRTLMETYKVLRVGPQEITEHRDGVSLNTPMIRALTALGLFDRTKPSAPDSMAIKGQLSEFNEKILSTPAFLWIATSDNERKTQLVAGRAYVRVQLAATSLGLFMHPVSQALQEYPEQAEPYKAIHQLLGGNQNGRTVQMWTRLGAAKPTEPSPRKDVEAFIAKA